MFKRSPSRADKIALNSMKNTNLWIDDNGVINESNAQAVVVIR